MALASLAGALLIAIVIYSVSHPSHPEIPKVVIGGSDDVYYSHEATAADAQALGQALEHTGFFNGRGTGVLLSKSASGTIISFTVNEGAWDHPQTISSFEEIARRVASSIGGFPLEVRLCDSKWGVHRQLAVGRVLAGAKDEVYYYGSATQAQADALGRALKSAGYLADKGASVVLSKDDATTSIGFVLGNGAWNDPATITAFETLTRKIAPSIGGLPIDLRLMSPEMEIKREANVR